MKYFLLLIIVLGVGINIFFALTNRKKNKKMPLSGEKGYVAQVMCGGTDTVAPRLYKYDGIRDCAAIAKLHGGPKGCKYGCMGQGNCAAACDKGAIHIIGGVAAVDRSKCDACGKCVSVCPQGIIKLIPADKRFWIGCSSCDDPQTTVSYCNIGCVACGECIRVCANNAIGISDGRAIINPDLCNNCGECAIACLRQTVWKI